MARGRRVRARREQGEYWTYSTGEKRRRRAPDQARWRQRGAVAAPGLRTLRLRACVLLGGWLVAISAANANPEAAAYPWLDAAPTGTIASRVAVPPGFSRLPAAPGSFAAWLRGLPVKAGRPEVRLFDGRKKTNQQAHHVVVEIDVGRRDRQQCADAVMRLRAEYQHQAGRDGDICFRFTDGSAAQWAAWKAGQRPRLGAGKTAWEKNAAPDGSYASFRRYLDIVFSYAGTLSLARELDKVADPRRIEAGDVFIQGGSPGHAVIVVDVAEDAHGRRAVLLAQSYMPAQDIHVLRNPKTSDQPWYVIEGEGPLATPEWNFPAGSLRRFTAAGCPK
jgi:hypothetical protein